MDANGQNLGVTGRVTGNGKTIYEVAANIETADQGVVAVKLATFDANLANTAQALSNTRCSFRITVKKSGQYTNYYLEEIAPEGQLAAASAIPIQGAGGAGKPGAARGGGGFKRSPEETASIVKQNVLGTAHHFVAALYTGLGPEFLEEAKAHAKAYAAELFEIAKPKSPAAAGVAQAIVPAVAQPVAPAAAPEPVQPVLEPGTALATPAAVAAAVPGVVVGAPAAAVAAIPVQGAEPSGAADIAWS